MIVTIKTKENAFSCTFQTIPAYDNDQFLTGSRIVEFLEEIVAGIKFGTAFDNTLGTEKHLTINLADGKTIKELWELEGGQ